MMKKLISFCLAFVMVLSAVSVLPVSAEGTLKASDVSKEAGLLQAVGIIGSLPDEQEGNREITRAEFAVTVAKAMGIKTTKEDTFYFTDIPQDHWSVSYVNRLVEMGVISQPADKLFRPNDKITVNEAMKILVCILGYGEYALMVGSYPAGYAEVASKLEFSITGGYEPLTVYKSYIMLYDALRSPVFEKTAAGSGYASYQESDDTMLSKYFDVYEAEGVITQSAGISVYGDVITGKTNADTAAIVVIDNESYISSLDLSEYLGRRSRVFYVQKDKDDDKNIIYREDYKREDNVIDISYEDFHSYENGVFSYYDEKGKLVKEDVPMGTIVVKNGEIVTKDVFEAYNINKGDIRIIDIEDDGIFDIALISEYENIVADRISNDTYTVYDKINPSKSVTLDENKKIVFIEDSTGAKKSFSDIKAGQVITVYESETYAKAIIGADGVSATLYSSKEDEDKFMLELGKSESDRTWHTVDKDYYNDYILGKFYVDSNGNTVYTGDIDLSPGGTVTYYKDAAGNIAYLTGPTPSGWTISYLVKANHNEDDDCAMLKVFTQSGEMLTLKVSDKVTVDGVIKRGYSETLQAMDKTKFNGGKTLETNEHNVNGQVIRYKLNAKGDISAIDTENVNSNVEERENLHRSNAAKAYTWWYHTTSFYSGGTPVLFYTGNTIKLGVPSHAELPDAADDDFSVMSTYTDTTTHVMAGFKLDPKSANESVLIEYGAAGRATAKGPFLVESIYKSADSDGDINMTADVYNIESCSTLKITAKDGYEFTYNTGVRDGDGNPIYANVEKGDIILANVDGKGLVSDVTMYYDYSRRNDADYTVQTGWLRGNGTHQEDVNTYLLAAYVKSFDEGLLRFTYNPITSDDLSEENYAKYTWATKNDAKTVLTFDGKNIEKGTDADIVPATVTGAEEAPVYFFAIRYARVKGAVIYK